MQTGYRSQWAKNVGGAAKPEPTVFIQAGDRSLLFFWGGGAARPPSRGDFAGPRSLLAYWMGGAALNYIPRPEVPVYPGPPTYPSDLTGGGLAKHRRKHIIDDEGEILEFIRLWTLFNDVE